MKRGSTSPHFMALLAAALVTACAAPQNMPRSELKPLVKLEGQWYASGLACKVVNADLNELGRQMSGDGHVVQVKGYGEDFKIVEIVRNEGNSTMHWFFFRDRQTCERAYAATNKK